MNDRESNDEGRQAIESPALPPSLLLGRIHFCHWPAADGLNHGSLSSFHHNGKRHRKRNRNVDNDDDDDPIGGDVSNLATQAPLAAAASEYEQQLQPLTLNDGVQRNKQRKRGNDDNSYNGNVPPIVSWIWTPLKAVECRNHIASCSPSGTLQGDDDRQPHRSYLHLLSIPWRLQQTVCRACQYQSTVRLLEYQWQVISDSYGGVPQQQRTGDGKNRSTLSQAAQRISLVLIHVFALEIVDNDHVDKATTLLPDPSEQPLQSSPLTLSHALQEQQQHQRNGSTNPQSSDILSFSAQVVALSPLLLLKTSESKHQKTKPKRNGTNTDMFALMELYETHSTLSCVVVLQHDALPLWNAMAVGQTLIVKHVKSQAWRVPDRFRASQQNSANHLFPDQQHFLLNRIPSHVFVVQQMDQIEWEALLTSSSILASPPSPLCSAASFGNVEQTLLGRVKCVHWIQIGTAMRRIHVLDVVVNIFAENDETSGGSQPSLATKHHHHHHPVVQLLVTYFPMTTSLQGGLRPGAIVQATGLHRLHHTAYCACLRSRLILLEPTRIVPEQQQAQVVVVDPESARYWLPCDVIPIRRSYPELWLRRHVMDFAKMIRDDYVLDASMIDAMVQALWNTTQTTFRQLRRDHRSAYAEFFDHDLERTNVWQAQQDHVTYGCHMSAWDRSGSRLPSLISMRHILDTSMTIFAERLRTYRSKLKPRQAPNMIKEKEDPFSTGWHGSISIAPSSLLKRYVWNREPFGAEDALSVYTAGHVSTHDEGLSAPADTTRGFLLELGSLALPVVVCNNQDATGTLFSHAASQPALAFVRIESVRVSCLCIHTVDSIQPNNAVHESQSQQHLGQQTLTLPLHQTDASKVHKDGPTVLFELDGYVFVGSCYIHCDGIVPVQQGVPHLNRTIITESSRSVSVGDCLNPETWQDIQPNEAVAGILVRKTLRAFRIQNQSYTGLTIIVSHAPATAVCHDQVSCLQSIAFKPVVQLEKEQCRRMSSLLSSIWGRRLPSDRIGMVCSWWKQASSHHTCAMLGGGWDELVDSESSSRSISQAIMIQVPCVTSTCWIYAHPMHDGRHDCMAPRVS